MAVLGGVVEFDFAAGAFFRRVDHAGIDGLGIDVEGDGAGVVLAGIQDAMDGLGGIDGAGLRGSHFDDVGGFELAFAGGEIFEDGAVILDEEFAERGGHPAVLSLVIVDGAELAGFPADGDEFVKGSFVHKIAGVMLRIPVEIGGE